MRSAGKILLFTMILWVAPALILAQGMECPAIVETALRAADKLCAATGRNQACYGHLALTAEAQPAAADFHFEAEGDIVDVVDLQSLTLSAMDEMTGAWGVALLRLQANIPDTMPGENITFLLFGDVEVTNAVEEGNTGLNPMQAFYLRTGIGDSQCAEAPDSGLIVQTPEGVGEIQLTVNGVQVEMGSTVLFQTAAAENEMQITTLEGHAVVQSPDGRQGEVPAGSRLRMTAHIGNPGRIVAAPAPAAPSDSQSAATYIPPTPIPPVFELESYNNQPLQALPLGLLDRTIEVHTPLDSGTLSQIREHMQEDIPCGPLRSCDPVPPKNH
ncbi:MAG: hypothetical protein K8I60_23165 [Anaerolineae bacterium]|nr:hypothetical protein [Anaerolineae bacterium]